MKKYTSQHILSQCSVLFAFIVIFQSCYPWFLWGDILVGNISIMLFLVCRILLRSKISNRYRLPAFFLFLFYLWMGIYQAEQLQTPVVQLIKRILPLFFIVSMQKEEKVRLKDLTINIISLILFISFVAYVFIIFLELCFSFTISIWNVSSFYYVVLATSLLAFRNRIMGVFVCGIYILL